MAVNGILGIKLGMTQVFGDDGTSIPCTVLQAGPCVVVDRRTKDKHGYDAVQLGLVEFIKPQRVNKAMTGHFKKAGVAPMRFLGEFRLEESKDETKAGDRVLVDGFTVGELVDVAGISKGRGFAGGVKRWHYAGGDASHGSMFHRAPGGIGASSFPSRVWKNQHFPGHMGNVRKTSKNLKVVKIDADENLLFVRGAVAGPTGAYIYVKKAKSSK
ncbi:MAG: 50S ribosomal protein L3 [Candidatus Acidiferrales bacterium]